MAKSKILKELANNEVTIDVALNRLWIIANDLDNEELFYWVENELNGYKKEDDLPSYRKGNAPNLIYSGINGSFQVTNQPLPLAYLNKDVIDSIKTICFFESVGLLQAIANEKEQTNRVRDLTPLAGDVYTNSGGIRCFSIKQIIPHSAYVEVVNKVKAILMKLFMKLDKEFGNLDELDINTGSQDASMLKSINQQVYSIVVDNSVHIGDGNKIDKSYIANKR